jgi:HAD superfamily hydrolase (TIGR01509 family)
MTPKAVFLDLDDTILNDSLNIGDCWELACDSCRDDWADIDRAHLLSSIVRTRDWFWSDRDRHRRGRLDLRAARTEIVEIALREMGLERPALARSIGEAYSDERERRMEPLPGAIETVRWLRGQSCHLVLLTNGSSAAQRRKIERFALADLFHHILIEGEMGFGKPDPRAFARALGSAGVDPSDAWMVGDNLEWDVSQARRLGIHAIWVDHRGRGVPEGSDIHPDRIVQSIAELRVETLLRGDDRFSCVIE